MANSLKSKLETQQRALVKMKAELLAARRHLQDTFMNPGGRLPDASEFAAQVTEQDVATWMLNVRSQILQQIDEALGRVEQGAYGICQACSEPITEKRLKAIPWARFCFECQQMGCFSND